MRIIGLLTILLGVVSVALLVACGIMVWRVAGVVVDRTDRITERSSERLKKVEGKLLRLEGKVKDITVDVDKIRVAVARLILRTLKDLPALKDAPVLVEFRQLLERLDHLLQQCEELGETLSIVARLFDDTADLSTQLGGDQNRTDQMRTISETLEEVAATLTHIRGELAELRQREPDPQKLADLIEQTRGPLQRLADGIAKIRQHSVDAREALDHLRREVRFWTTMVAILLTLVLVWFGLGQVCLIGWGWKRLRSRTLPIAPKEVSPG